MHVPADRQTDRQTDRHAVSLCRVMQYALLLLHQLTVTHEHTVGLWGKLMFNSLQLSYNFDSYQLIVVSLSIIVITIILG